MGQTPGWALAISFWLHMLATVVWIGGLAALVLLIIPNARRSLKAKDFHEFLDRVNRQLNPVGWFSLGLLTATGLVQMGANPNYEGLLAFNNSWSQALLIKHIVFIGMIALSSYLTWGVTPALQRAVLLRARDKGGADEDELRQRELQILRLNFILGIVVLALTALARIA